jgi:hypothetical protein
VSAPADDADLARQRALRDLCLRPDVRPADLEALGGEAGRWLVYRRMVRARLREAVGHGFERLAARVGAATFGAWFEAFLARRPPRSAYLREVAGEFAAFLTGGYERPGDPHPALTCDLARFEWAELDCAYEAAPPPASAPLAMHLRPALSPAHRLLRLEHAAHRLGRDEPLADVAPGPLWVCAYRDPATFDVRVLELTEVTGRLLAAMARAERPLVELVREAADGAAVVPDAAWLASLSDVLADFVERGLLLGSWPEGAPGAGA